MSQEGGVLEKHNWIFVYSWFVFRALFLETVFDGCESQISFAFSGHVARTHLLTHKNSNQQPKVQRLRFDLCVDRRTTPLI